MNIRLGMYGSRWHHIKFSARTKVDDKFSFPLNKNPVKIALEGSMNMQAYQPSVMGDYIYCELSIRSYHTYRYILRKQTLYLKSDLGKIKK